MALINLAVLFVIGGLSAYPNVGKHLLATATYSHYLVFGHWSTINFLAWSLEVEAQFYIVMPLIAYGCFRIRNPVWRRLALLAPCVPAIAWQMARHGDHFPRARLYWFGRIHCQHVRAVLCRLQPASYHRRWQLQSLPVRAKGGEPPRSDCSGDHRSSRRGPARPC